MAPARGKNGDGDGGYERSGPLPSLIQVAKPFVFEHTIQQCIESTGIPQTREDQLRLQGVQWIDNVRKALRLPVRTFDTAVVYYHKFRLVHGEAEYSYVDAAAAALFTACKIEDTLKKSRDILCAAHNLRLPVHEQLSPDDSVFEPQARGIIGLERLMLEASSFDFRNRHPQNLLVKLLKHYQIPKTSQVAITAYKISIDLYRTFAPLKQTTPTLAFACLELSRRLLGCSDDNLIPLQDPSSWKVSRAEVMETLLDLLELYTHYRNATMLGPDFPLDLFLQVRIPLNQEISASNLPRFTEYRDPPSVNAPFKPTPNGISNPPNGNSTSTTTPTINNTKLNSVSKPTPHSLASPSPPLPNPQTSTITPPASNGTSSRPRIGERGHIGTVRFMLSAEREHDETAVVATYFPTSTSSPERERRKEAGPGKEKDRDREGGRGKEREREREDGKGVLGDFGGRERERERETRYRPDVRDRDPRDRDLGRPRERERERDRDRDRERDRGRDYDERRRVR